MDGIFVSSDLRRIAKRAWKRGRRDQMQPADVEDVIGDVLVDSVRTAIASGGSIVALAHTNVERGRYATRVVMQAEVTAGNHALNVGLPSLTVAAEDYDYAYVASHSSTFVPEDIEAVADLWDLIYRLPVEQARAFTLNAYYGFTLSDTAWLLGTPISTVDRNVKRARTSLQQSLLTP